MQEISCKDECGVKIKVSEISEHDKVCPKRLVKCDDCAEKIKIYDLEAHIKNLHIDSLIEKFDQS